jgi:RNA polymerase sigma factor (sigma-70 family)
MSRHYEMTPQLIQALIVEDDASWQQILSEILVDAGLIVDVAGNLDEALITLKLASHRLAIVDLSLAGDDHHNYDGLRILEAVHRLDPGCQTILLTGFATVELAVSVLTEYGAFTFLRKENFHRAQFRDLIDRALASAPVLENNLQNTTDRKIIRAVTANATPDSSDDTVLVVEDDAGWRSILSEILSDAGYKVCLSSSFGDALGHLRRDKFVLAVVDLSLTDQVFWEQNTTKEHLEGFQLLSNTRASAIPTIVVSGISSAPEIERAYSEYSIYAFLEKQAFDRSVFNRLIEEAILSRREKSALDPLTEREREVLILLASGMTNKEIATKLVITTNTVKRHLKAIFEKLGVHTRSAAAAKAVGDTN